MGGFNGFRKRGLLMEMFFPLSLDINNNPIHSRRHNPPLLPPPLHVSITRKPHKLYFSQLLNGFFPIGESYHPFPFFFSLKKNCETEIAKTIVIIMK